MNDSITDVPGILVGHAQDLEAGTGCTVILCPAGAVAGVDVRGGAPGTRELAALNPVNLVPQAHAVYLSGGSAFGLDGAGGVMQYLEERGIGFDVEVTRVPIVPGAVLFDLLVGSHSVRPDRAMGYAACLAATADNTAQGNVGAGTGATVGKAAGPSRCMKSGLGTASARSGDLVVGAIVALNSFGDIVDPATGRILAGTLNEDRTGLVDSLSLLCAAGGSGFAGPTIANTTIGAIATNARLDKAGATRVAMMAHDGFARTTRPAHTMLDGDTIFCLAPGRVEADVNVVGCLAAEVMARAIVNAIRRTTGLYGCPCWRDIADNG